MTMLPVRLENVSASLGQCQVLHAVSLEIAAGEHVGLVGPNGAGKSTLLKLLAGVLPVSQGQLLRAGEVCASAGQQARHLAYLPQQKSLAWSLMVEDVVALGRHAWGGGTYDVLGVADRNIVDTAMDRAGVSRFAGRAVTALSGGEQARVHLARVLACKADLLLLDEPCASLDLRHQFDLMEVLETERAKGAGIVTVLHDLALAERFCTRLVVLDAGRIVASGTPANALNDKLLLDVFGLARGTTGQFTPARQVIA